MFSFKILYLPLLSWTHTQFTLRSVFPFQWIFLNQYNFPLECLHLCYLGWDHGARGRTKMRSLQTNWQLLERVWYQLSPLCISSWILDSYFGKFFFTLFYTKDKCSSGLSILVPTESTFSLWGMSLLSNLLLGLHACLIFCSLCMPGLKFLWALLLYFGLVMCICKWFGCFYLACFWSYSERKKCPTF